MAYVAAADFRERTQKPWTANCLLTEGEATDAYLDLMITQVVTQIELDLDDDFDPSGGDPDETVVVDGTLGSRLHIPRRVRALTSVSSQAITGSPVAISSTSYRLHASLNATGTAMVDRRKRDWLDSSSATTWASSGGIQLVGKFGWAVVPGDIKRLASLRVYRMVKANGDPLTTITQRTTADAIMTFGPSDEETRIVNNYSRAVPALA